MNHELKAAYNALATTERQQLAQEFANSPKALLLLRFLNELKGKDFTNQQIIPHIYGNEDSNFETLRNRYFKLRKTILERVQAIQRQQEAVEGFPFPEEQGELYHIKQLIKKEGQYGIARQKLEPLIKKLWQDNLFEILPEALQSLMYCRQAMGEYHQNEILLKEWEMSIALQHDISQVRLLSTKALNEYHEGGIQPVLKVLLMIKRIIQSKKEYPRFAIAYHLSHVLNGTATMGNRPGALTRHIKEYERLRNAHPSIPSFNYETNHLWTERFRYLYSKGLYSYLKNDYQAFYQSQKEAYQLTATIPELRGARSEAMCLNKIRTETLLGYYAEALQTARELQEFQKEHRLTANIWKTLLEMGRIYVYSFPKVGPENLKVFIDTLVRNLNNATAAMSEPEKGEAFGVVAILRFYNHEYKEALKTYERPETKGYFDITGVEVFHQIFLVPGNGKGQAQRLLKDIKQAMYREENPAIRSLLIKGSHMVEAYIAYLSQEKK